MESLKRCEKIFLLFLGGNFFSLRNGRHLFASKKRFMLFYIPEIFFFEKKIVKADFYYILHFLFALKKLRCSKQALKEKAQEKKKRIFLNLIFFFLINSFSLPLNIISMVQNLQKIFFENKFEI